MTGRRLAWVGLVLWCGCGGGGSTDGGANDAGTPPRDDAGVLVLPGAPTAPSAVAGDAQVSLQWSAPGVSGTGSIIDYVVQWQGGSQHVGSASTSVVVTGLTNGQVYSFTVSAVNAAGIGPASLPSAAVSPGAAPEAPSQVHATGGELAVVTWVAPNDRGRPITSYAVTASSGETALVTGATTASFVLPSGAYTFTVVATNELGTSASSAPSNQVSVLVHPPAPPIAATAVTTPTGVLVRWSPPRLDGGVTTGYRVDSSPVGLTATTTGATQVALNGIPEGINYTFAVRATNSAGDSESSLSSNLVMFSRLASVCTTVFAGRAADPITVNEPISVASGQLEGDGLLDLFVIDPNTLYLARGRGDGTFQLRVSYAPAANLTSLAVGDLNGDSFADAVVASASTGVTVMLSDGLGGLGTATTWATGGSAKFVLITRLDANSSPDLAVLNSDTGTVAVLFNDGSGIFSGLTTYPVVSSPGLANLQMLAAADFNGDGLRDLALPGSGSLNLLLGLDGGTFELQATQTLSPNVHQIAVNDFNGDGRADVFAAAGDQFGSVVLLGNGDATFSGASLATGVPTFATSTDLDGDGTVDLALVGDNALSLFPGNGDGTFGAAVVLPVGLDPLWATFADFNRDGVADVVTANRGNPFGPAPLGTVTLVLGEPNRLPSVNTVALGQYSLPAFVADDFNVDGFLDVAVLQQSAVNDFELKLLHGTGAGGFRPAVVAATVSNPTAIRSGDFDRDGIPDVALTGTSGGIQIINLTVLRGDADGGFQLTGLYGGNGANAAALAVADFNEDGVSDIAVATKNYFGVDVYLGEPGGTFATARRFLVGGGPGSIVSADFDGDGNADLATANEMSNSVSVLLGLGDGRFSTAQDFPVGTTPIALAVGDLNDDGVPDLVTANQATYTVSVLLGRASGGFANAVTTGVGSVPTGVAIADLTTDGHPDVVVSMSNFRVAVMKGTGSGALGVPAPYPSGGSPLAITVGQFDGDGRPDVALIEGRGIGLLTNACVP